MRFDLCAPESAVSQTPGYGDSMRSAGDYVPDVRLYAVKPAEGMQDLYTEPSVISG